MPKYFYLVKVECLVNITDIWFINKFKIILYDLKDEFKLYVLVVFIIIFR